MISSAGNSIDYVPRFFVDVGLLHDPTTVTDRLTGEVVASWDLPHGDLVDVITGYLSRRGITVVQVDSGGMGLPLYEDLARNPSITVVPWNAAEIRKAARA